MEEELVELMVDVVVTVTDTELLVEGELVDELLDVLMADEDTKATTPGTVLSHSQKRRMPKYE